jgi:hypothetical protein
MPDRLDGDHRRIRSRTSLRGFRALLLAAALVLAAPVALAQAAPATKKRASSRPTVSAFSFSPAGFAVGQMLSSGRAQRATTITYRLSKRSTVTIRIARKLAGRKSGRRCVKSTSRLRSRPGCSRYVTSGTLIRPNQGAGTRTLAFSGRLHGRALPLGSYRATIRARDRRRHKSAPKITTFTVGAGQPQQSSGTPAAPAVPTAPGAQRRLIRPCTVTLPNIGAVVSAVASAVPGSVVCVAPGTYGKLTLSARPAGEVVIQPAGTATIAGASLSGSHLTLEGFNVAGDEVAVQPGSDHIAVQFNQISGGYFGVDAGPTTNTNVSDVVVRGNKLVGPFGEDAIRLNRYHDGDGDGVGILIEGNEITAVRENGNHSDCLQSVWGGDHLVFRRNYLHDNRCQGFFIKDQPANVDGVVATDNLMLRDAAPCAVGGCGQPSVFQLFGPMSNLVISQNTIWTPEGETPVTLRDSGWGPVSVSGNVIYRFWSDTAAPFASYTASNNVAAKREGTWPATGIAIVGGPRFQNPAVDDYRTNDGRGVTWAPAEQHYGP